MNNLEMNMTAEAKFLTISEASTILNKPEVTIKRYARESLLKSVKVDGVLMFPEDAVSKYLEITQRLK
jgi:predicted site-specific integrase-resolvase